MTAPAPDTVTRGDCLDVMKEIPSRSVDFILTDPPYLVRYVDRTGRSVKNDNNDSWIDPAFAEMHRVLKDSAFCVSFYAWNRADRFIEAWRKAGFSLAGHFAFPKRYASSRHYTQYQHEQAYLLMKGHPKAPENPPPDVIPWTYTGNRLHPTQKPVGIFLPLLKAYTKPGDVVLDPFAGSASTLVAAQEMDRRFIGIELDPDHQATATARLQSRFMGDNVVPLPKASRYHAPRVEPAKADLWHNAVANSTRSAPAYAAGPKR